jgi:hypothetical protein
MAGGIKELPEQRLRCVKTGEHDEILIRARVVGHARGDLEAGKDVADKKRR